MSLGKVIETVRRRADIYRRVADEAGLLGTAIKVADNEQYGSGGKMWYRVEVDMEIVDVARLDALVNEELDRLDLEG